MTKTIPQILDVCTGVIRGIDSREVYASLFPLNSEGEHEYSIDLKRQQFDDSSILIKEHEGFFFWVERYQDGREVSVLKPIQIEELTSEDRKNIDKEIENLLV